MEEKIEYTKKLIIFQDLIDEIVVEFNPPKGLTAPLPSAGNNSIL